MKRINWNSLDDAQRSAALARPRAEESLAVDDSVDRIIAQVQADGDNSVRALTRRFDNVAIGDLRVDPALIQRALSEISSRTRSALETALATLTAWHEETRVAPFEIETVPGVRCGRIIRPIQTVGLYVPAGSAPLPSTVLMLGVPARLAECPRIVMCSPPNSAGELDPVVLAAAGLAGINEIYRIGGAQAVAAMAFGTETVPRCDKLFGPGNRWVTRAKQRVAQMADGVAIDMPAGPSEVLVIADDAANPEFVAADLLSQAEHGEDSQALLVTTDNELINRVLAAINRQLDGLSRADVARKSLETSVAINVSDLAQAMEVSNRYAPEHLIINTESPERLLDDVRCAGSVFLGPWSPEALGDYCSGTNHVLPTAGWARSVSGVSVDSFITRISVQQASPEGLRHLAPCAERLASCEGLDAHERAVAIRREALSA